MKRLQAEWLPLCLFAFSILVHACFLGSPELLPQEAYYWSYSQHLSYGYLDHPPLSAWLIALFQFGLPPSEVSVRFPALLALIITAYYSAKTTLICLGPYSSAWAPALVASLPYFFGATFFMTPDAPLIACWSAAIYFLTAIVCKQTPEFPTWGAWAGLGISVGLGMLSKYTICLLVLGALIVFLKKSALRPWFATPYPYLAALIATTVFSPVIVWNYQHDWASFAFQGSRRLQQSKEFGLPLYLGQLLALGTPAAVVFSFIFCRQRVFERMSPLQTSLFRATLTAPVFLFAGYSLQHETKMIWAGPALLSIVPPFAAWLSREESERGRYWQKVSVGIVVVGLAIFTMVPLILGPAITLFPSRTSIARFAGWSELSFEVLAEAERLRRRGYVPLVVGMDKHYTAAELNFYLAKNKPAESAPLEVTGRGLFGLDSLMWHFWRPNSDLTGRTLILVSRTRSDLERPEVDSAFDSFEPTREFQAYRENTPVGRYYIRIAHGFRPSKNAQDVFFLPD